MARIRTFKPDFFVDSKTGKLTPRAKVLFLGLLCLADDYGVLALDLDEMRVKVFPYEPFDSPADVVWPLLSEELLPLRLVTPFRVNPPSSATLMNPHEDSPEGIYLWVTHFMRHQKVGHPAAPLLPLWKRETTPHDYPGAELIGPDPSSNLAVLMSAQEDARGLVNPHPRDAPAERKGKERKGTTERERSVEGAARDEGSQAPPLPLSGENAEAIASVLNRNGRRAVVVQPPLPASPYVRAVIGAWDYLNGRHSPDDVGQVEEWERAFEYLSADRIVERLREEYARWPENQKPRKLAALWPSMQRENSYLADHGGPKR